MKHTLINRIKSCPRCRINPCRKNSDGDFIICRECETSAKLKREMRNRIHAESNLKRLMGISNLPLRHSNADIENVKTPIDPEASFLFLGSKGLGKTYTMTAIAKELILRGKRVRYTTVPELMMELRSSFTDTENNEHKVIDRYLSTEFLFLDDIGVEKPSEWVLQVLFILIDRRYMENKHICVSSNLSLTQMSKREDARIVSRLVEMCEVIEFKGDDRRIS